MKLATQTLELINSALERDGGAEYRRHLGLAIKECTDAFNPKQEDGLRGHLGASLIGRPCARALWYSFRWATLTKVPARIVRLFNRGHLEEARFIALLRQAGLTSWHSTEEGKQFRITSRSPHFGGSLDGVVASIPECDFPCLLEFKTHGLKSFTKLVQEGVAKAKPEHLVQCSIYMDAYGLKACLYCAVCKDNDELHLEIVYADPRRAEGYVDRALAIIATDTEPAKISNTASWFECKFCDHSQVCHNQGIPHKSCRTCQYSKPMAESKNWLCRVNPDCPVELEEAKQKVGCSNHLRKF